MLLLLGVGWLLCCYIASSIATKLSRVPSDYYYCSTVKGLHKPNAARYGELPAAACLPVCPALSCVAALQRFILLKAKARTSIL